MKLSEAIRLGSMLKPQGFGTFRDEEGTCALGAALDACGALEEHQLGRMVRLHSLFPLLNDINGLSCPVCEDVGEGHDENTIPHLNDEHRWTREQIADWIQGIEEEQERGTKAEADRGQVRVEGKENSDVLVVVGAD